MTGEKQTILRTDQLKAFYVLEMYGTQKIVKAVNDVEMKIYENEIYGIAGESGCGKTTLLKALFGAIEPPLRLIDGKVFYRWNDDEVNARALSQEGDEIEVTALSPEEKRRLRLEFASYVPQGSMSVLNPVLKIKNTFQDFIASHVSGKSRKEAFTIAESYIVELGLPRSILEAYPHQLSGGMRQRVTIALATLLRPRVIIADEPTTALDVVVQRGVVQLLKQIQEKLKNTIILVTHDMGVHANIADRVGIMYAGKIVEEATTGKIFDEPFHPYTKYLIDSLPRFGDKTIRASVPGNPPSLSNLPGGCPFHPRCPHVFGVCTKQMPSLISLEANHKVACWLVGKGANGKAA